MDLNSRTVYVFNGLFTLTVPDSNSGPDSHPIPVVGSQDWNMNPTPCSVKSSIEYNVAIWFVVRIGIRIGIRIWQCKSWACDPGKIVP